MDPSQLVEHFLASSQAARAGLLQHWTVAWARGDSFGGQCLSALLESSKSSPVRLQQIDDVVSATLATLLLDGQGGSASLGAAVAAAYFLCLHPMAMRLRDALGEQLRTQADPANTHAAIAMLARQQARVADGGDDPVPRSIAMELLELRIADYTSGLPAGPTAQAQQARRARRPALGPPWPPRPATAPRHLGIGDLRRPGAAQGSAALLALLRPRHRRLRAPAAAAAARGGGSGVSVAPARSVSEGVSASGALDALRPRTRVLHPALQCGSVQRLCSLTEVSDSELCSLSFVCFDL